MTGPKISQRTTPSTSSGTTATSVSLTLSDIGLTTAWNTEPLTEKAGHPSSQGARIARHSSSGTLRATQSAGSATEDLADAVLIQGSLAGSRIDERALKLALGLLLLDVALGRLRLKGGATA